MERISARSGKLVAEREKHDADKHTEGDLQIPTRCDGTSKAGLLNSVHLQPQLGGTKINNTIVGTTCRSQPGAHQDGMFIEGQWKREMSALKNLDNSAVMDEVVGQSFYRALRQMDRQTYTPTKGHEDAVESS